MREVIRTSNCYVVEKLYENFLKVSAGDVLWCYVRDHARKHRGRHDPKSYGYIFPDRGNSENLYLSEICVCNEKCVDCLL